MVHTGSVAAGDITILEDDPDLRTVLRDCLREEGFSVTAVATARQFLAHAGEHRSDALVVDIGLPDADGRDVCQALRARGDDTPVLFLTAKDALVDRLAGFRAGGDDYLTKPFSFDELIARLEVLVRRKGTGSTTEHGALQLDPVAHTASVAEVTLTLTPTEFRILATLCTNGAAVTRRREIVRAAWPQGAVVHDNTLDTYIRRLRRKLEDVAGAPEIATVHGVGYRIQ